MQSATFKPDLSELWWKYWNITGCRKPATCSVIHSSFIQIINFHGLFRNALRCQKTGACWILVPLRYSWDIQQNLIFHLKAISWQLRGPCGCYGVYVPLFFRENCLAWLIREGVTWRCDRDETDKSMCELYWGACKLLSLKQMDKRKW